ncbi:nitroreductase [Bacillus sp. RG28]|uniref:Putative NAD(P)H nitroreductase n=1 Tax=Gottfriedia endophytica TaxID=2820819 RepID=A0A940SLZ4_9BACI|nr:nitroreductase [Gottfriedia endophytica]MBP0726828.1 nitroreductase [Gottfriedia endophytica]
MKSKTMTVAEIVRSRRTVKKYNDKTVNENDIIEILNDAVWAPNHHLNEPWRFLLFQEEGRNKVADAFLSTYGDAEIPTGAQNKANYFRNVPAALLVVMPDSEDNHQFTEDICAVSALIQNFQLLAWEKELGVLWKTGKFMHNPLFKEKAGVREDERVVGLLLIGYFDEAPTAKPRTDAREKLTIYK